MLWATRHIVIALHQKQCGLVGLGPPSWVRVLDQQSAPGATWCQNSYLVLNPIYTWSSIFPPPTWSSECLFEKIRQFRPVRYRVGARLVRWCRGKSTIYLRAVVTYFVLWSWARKRCKFSFDFLSCEESYYIALVQGTGPSYILISNISDGEEKHNGALLFLFDNGKWPSQSEEASAKVLKRGGAEESLPSLLYHFFLPTYKALPWRGKPLPTLPPVPFLFVQ